MGPPVLLNRDILVIGSANADMVIRLPKLPALGETVTDGHFTATYGGKGANQAVAAARAGGRVTLLACVGDDVAGHTMRSNFAADNIDTSLIVVVPDVPSGMALIMIDQRGNNYLAVAPGSNYRITPQHIALNQVRIASASIIVMQMEIPIEVSNAALDAAVRCNVPVLFNYAPVRQNSVKIDARMTGLVVNEIEAEEILGCTVNDTNQAMDAARALQRMGPRFAIVTLGKSGVCVAEAEGSAYHLPAFQVTPVDTTAAGDTFCGALAVSLVEQRPLREAVEFASAAAALSVTRMGAQPSIPTRDEIDRFAASVSCR
jgi:ribokinase